MPSPPAINDDGNDHNRGSRAQREKAGGATGSPRHPVHRSLRFPGRRAADDSPLGVLVEPGFARGIARPQRARARVLSRTIQLASCPLNNASNRAKQTEGLTL